MVKKVSREPGRTNEGEEGLREPWSNRNRGGGHRQKNTYQAGTAIRSVVFQTFSLDTQHPARYAFPTRLQPSTTTVRLHCSNELDDTKKNMSTYLGKFHLLGFCCVRHVESICFYKT